MHIDESRPRTALDADQHHDRDPDNARRWMLLTPTQCLITAAIFFSVLVMIGAIPGYARAVSNATDDKLLHLCAYGLLTALLFNGLHGVVLGRALATMLLIALLGALDEAIQSFMPYRSASIIDWYFDVLAALVCVMALVMRELAKRVSATRD